MPDGHILKGGGAGTHMTSLPRIGPVGRNKRLPPNWPRHGQSPQAPQNTRARIDWHPCEGCSNYRAPIQIISNRGCGEENRSCLLVERRPLGHEVLQATTREVPQTIIQRQDECLRCLPRLCWCFGMFPNRECSRGSVSRNWQTMPAGPHGLATAPDLRVSINSGPKSRA